MKEQIDELLKGCSDGKHFITLPVALLRSARGEIERLTALTESAAQFNITLGAERDQLRQRLEISPDHNIDGIDARDATIKLQDDLIDQLKEQLKAADELAKAAYLLAMHYTDSMHGFVDENREEFEKARDKYEASKHD